MTIWLPYETRCKTGRCSAKVCATKSRLNFLHECIQSTPLDPKLTFCCVSYYMSAFGTVWLPYRTRCKTGRTSAKVRATKLHRIVRYERTRSTPLDPKLINLVRFVQFGCIWDRSVDLRNSVQNWPTSAKVRARSRIGIFHN